MIPTIVISCIVGVCAVLAAVYLIRRKIKNKGKCAGCDGHCYGCTSEQLHNCSQSFRKDSDSANK